MNQLAQLIRNIFIASLLVLVFPAQAVTLKIATVSPDGTSWMQSIRAGAKEIKEKTQGRVIFKFYPGGVMGSDENVLRKIRIGQLQGGAVTSGSFTDAAPDVGIYGLPYLFSSLEQVDYVRQRMDKALLEKLEAKGFVSFGLAEGGFSYMMSEFPLQTVDDVRKRKVWIPSGNEVGEAVFESANIAPVILPLSDVLTGLQTGLINIVITSPIGAIALQWHTRIQYVVDMPLTYFSALLVVDKKAFNKIKPADREIVRNVMGKKFIEIDQQNRKDNNAARTALTNQGIKFITLPSESTKQWHEIGDKAMLKLEKQNKYSEDIYNQLMKYVDEASKPK